MPVLELEHSFSIDLLSFLDVLIGLKEYQYIMSLGNKLKIQ